VTSAIGAMRVAGMLVFIEEICLKDDEVMVSHLSYERAAHAAK
jgi:hypothetical protein